MIKAFSKLNDQQCVALSDVCLVTQVAKRRWINTDLWFLFWYVFVDDLKSTQNPHHCKGYGYELQPNILCSCVYCVCTVLLCMCSSTKSIGYLGFTDMCLLQAATGNQGMFSRKKMMRKSHTKNLLYVFEIANCAIFF